MSLWQATVGVYLVVIVVAFLQEVIPLEDAFFLEILLFGSIWLGVKISQLKNIPPITDLIVILIVIFVIFFSPIENPGFFGGTALFGYVYGIFHNDKYQEP